MGIVSRTLNSLISVPENPTYIPTNCLNRRTRRFPCTKCVDLCPGNVFSSNRRAKINWDQCINCGICLNYCPTRCFVPGKQLRRNLTRDIQLSAPISFACYNDNTPCTKRVECLGGVPWELAATLAMYTDVVFYVGACSHCDHQTQVSCFHDSLAHLKEFLGDSLFSARVHLMTEGQFELPKKDSEEVSRRDLFSGAGKSMSQVIGRTALTLLPGNDDDDDQKNAFAFRDLLEQTTARVYQNYRKACEEYDSLSQEDSDKAGTSASDNSADIQAASPSASPDTTAMTASSPSAPERVRPNKPSFGVQLPRFTTACYGCGTCARLCPSKALEVGPPKDGKCTVYITPWKCTSCAACEKICIHGGINGLQLVKVPHLDRLALVRVNVRTCEVCGKILEPKNTGTLCPGCKRKADRKAKDDQRAEARAKKEAEAAQAASKEVNAASIQTAESSTQSTVITQQS